MRRAGRHRKNGIPPDEKAANREASQANMDASATLAEAHARTAEVASLAAQLKSLRERNHFGELVRAALGGGLDVTE